MTLLTLVFIVLALAAFLGFAINSGRRNGHGMMYSAVMALIWLAAAFWSAGALG